VFENRQITVVLIPDFVDGGTGESVQLPVC